ncbi:MAG: protein kinase, partial [Planctomycetes bacterium]|nr:protein kinase [Planctomycetota bacterium]
MASNTSLRENLTGAELGGCRIEAAVGGGSMGFVFKARHIALDKIVAIKVLTPELRNYKALRERFRTEARIASAIEHPNVVPIFGVGDENGYSYIIMRFFDGPSLYRLLSRQGIEPLLAAKIGENLASALAAIHRAGYVHRDVKPENVIITEKGQAILTDFGVASEIGVAEQAGRGGSPAYMSPEQCRGEPLDGRSDLYSLGVTLYQMLTGRRPFLGETRPSLLLMHQQDDFPPILSLRPDTLPLFAQAVERLLEKVTARRFQRAEDLVDVLRAVQEELRAVRRRSGVTVQRKTPAESAMMPAIVERDTEDVQLDEVAEDVELSLLSLDAEVEEATAVQSSARGAMESQRTAKFTREAILQSRCEAALARINRAVELRADDPNLRITRGNIFRRMRDNEKAEADYRRAAELAPDNPRALTTLGSFLVTIAKVKEAEESEKESHVVWFQLQDKYKKPIPNLECFVELKNGEASYLQKTDGQ